MSKPKDVTAALTIGAGKTCYPCALSRLSMSTVQVCPLFRETCELEMDEQMPTYTRCPACIKEYGIAEESA